jgi:hypothetical protein
MVTRTPFRDLAAEPTAAAIPYVVAEPAHPTTRLGRAVAALGDVALVLDAWGRQ